MVLQVPCRRIRRTMQHDAVLMRLLAMVLSLSVLSVCLSAASFSRIRQVRTKTGDLTLGRVSSVLAEFVVQQTVH